MSDMPILWAIAGFFVVLTPIILVHELGHFIAARLSGIRVEEFGFGFPPRAAKLAEHNGTVYSLNWIPLGGFVRPAGEDDPDVSDGLAAASKRARFFVLAAGAGANFIMAVVVWWAAFIMGPPVFDQSQVVIGSVFPESPAAAAGLQEGDRIVAVNGAPVEGRIEFLQQQVSESAGEPLQMRVERDGQELSVTMTPQQLVDQQAPMIGIQLGHPATGERAALGPIEALGESMRRIWEYVTLFVRVPAMLVSGELSPNEARPVSIVGISQIAGQAAETSATGRDPFPLLNMIAFISVALGLTNLLPIPALDGGRILFVLIEAVRGQRVEPEREGMVHVIGMLLLLGLMVLMIVQDIVNPIIPF
jgi:regulator of sigma E protease